MRLRLFATLLGLPVLLVVAFFRIRSGARWGTAALEFVVGAYALLVASMVFLPVFLDPAERARQALSAARFGLDWFNPVPFRTIGALVARATSTQRSLAIANTIMLLPLGVLVPVAFPWFRDWRRFVVLALGASVAIEFGQYLQRALGVAFRSVDIDDVILNTLGAVLGFAIFCAGAWVYGRLRAPASPVEQSLRADAQKSS